MAVAVVVVGIISPPPVTPVVVMMASVGSSLLLTSLVDSRSLSNAVVVAFPNDVGVWREGEQSLDRLPIRQLARDIYVAIVDDKSRLT